MHGRPCGTPYRAATARLAQDLRLTFPILTDEARLDLAGARHPLLLLDLIDAMPAHTGSARATDAAAESAFEAVVPESSTALVSGAGQSIEALRTELSTAGTLDALEYVLLRIEALPGRKSQVLVSEGYDLNVKDAKALPASD